MKKRLLATALTVVMLLSLLPFGAFSVLARDTHTHGTGTEAVNFEDAISTFAQLQSLFENGGSGYLTADINCNEALTVAKDVDLCLNGKVLNLNGNGNISINFFVTFNLYDCGSAVRYYDKNGDTGLWKLNTAKSSGDYTTVGGVITGGSATTDITGKQGGGIFVVGKFNMYGGNIVGNTASENGGGINIMSAGTVVLYGGNIIGNTAKNGGGIWMDIDGNLTLLSGNIIGNTATNQGGGIYYKGTACLAKGTMITLADGTRKPVEELDTGDDIKVFDHDIGRVSHAKISDYWHYGEPKSGAFTLNFSNGISVSVVTAHSFYEKEENRYVSLNTQNAKNYIGHFFYNADAGRWEKLESVTLLNEAVETYLVATEKHLDCITEGMLSCEDDIYTVFRNVFEFDKDMKVDKEKKTADIISADGLWTYDDCPLFTKESFDALNLQYAKVAVNKGMISYKDIENTAVYCSILDTGHFENGSVKKPQTFLASTPQLMAAPQPSVEDFKKLTVGGNVIVKDNYLKTQDAQIANNIYLTSETVINIATGAYAPKEKMLICVSVEANNELVPITGTAVTGNTKYFRSDDPTYMAVYDTDNSLINLKKIHAVHNLVKVNGHSPSETEVGFKDYYECKNVEDACHKCFEDENGTVPIEDLDEWKSEGGNGYLPKLEKELSAPKDGDKSNMTLWAIILGICVVGLCVCLILKKRNNK